MDPALKDLLDRLASGAISQSEFETDVIALFRAGSDPEIAIESAYDFFEQNQDAINTAADVGRVAAARTEDRSPLPGDPDMDQPGMEGIDNELIRRQLVQDTAAVAATDRSTDTGGIPYEDWNPLVGDPEDTTMNELGLQSRLMQEAKAQPRTAMADFLRGLESQTTGGRSNVFGREMALSPAMQYASPQARAVASRWFNPLSSQYLLAAAPEGLGGGVWGRTEEGVDPRGSTFEEFISSPQYSYLPGAEGTAGQYVTRAPSDNNPFASFTPFSAGQWRSRIAGMNLGDIGYDPQSGMTYRGTTGLDPARQAESLRFLAALTPTESQAMIRSASLAGLNPIMARAAAPTLDREFARFAKEQPDLSGGEMLRRWAPQFLGSKRVITNIDCGNL